MRNKLLTTVMVVMATSQVGLTNQMNLKQTTPNKEIPEKAEKAEKKKISRCPLMAALRGGAQAWRNRNKAETLVCPYLPDKKDRKGKSFKELKAMAYENKRKGISRNTRENKGLPRLDDPLRKDSGPPKK